jgi:hypothetical protein
VKANPWAGATVTATFAPETKLVEQVVPQEIPEGLLNTTPPFEGTACTVNACEVGAVDPGGFLVGVPPAELPESTRETVPPPPHPERMMVRRTINNPKEPVRRPPNWFTNSSWPGKNARRVLGAMLARR